MIWHIIDVNSVKHKFKRGEKSDRFIISNAVQHTFAVTWLHILMVHLCLLTVLGYTTELEQRERNQNKKVRSKNGRHAQKRTELSQAEKEQSRACAAVLMGQEMDFYVLFSSDFDPFDLITHLSLRFNYNSFNKHCTLNTSLKSYQKILI